MKKRGFTLIEVMVVIAIIATLSALIYASFNSTRARSRDQKRVSDIHELQLVLEQYFNAKNYYPADLHDLVVNGYIGSIPTPPSIDSDYHYLPITQTQTSPGNTYCTSYHLWIKLETASSYLSSRKGFSSDPLSPPLYLCSGGDSSQKINASLDPLVYDVTP